MNIVLILFEPFHKYINNILFQNQAVLLYIYLAINV